jgi:DNA-binding SARP family transcriptional activator
MLSRVYVCGRTCIDGPAAFLDEAAFPARQGRLVWTYLVLERHRTIARERIIEAVWGEDAPDASDRALSAILSKLRSLVVRAGIAGCAIRSVGTGVRLIFPSGIWIDWEAACADIERAARYCAEENVREAYGWALAAYMIAREDLLPGEEAPWLVCKRIECDAVLTRAIDALIHVYRGTDNLDMAVQFAEEAVARDPLRENAYRQLLELYAAVGNTSAVVRTYRRCSETLATHMHRSPSPAIDSAYHQALEAIAAQT